TRSKRDWSSDVCSSDLLLSLADIVDYDFTLSHENMAEVQERMPNRNGVVFWEGLWNVDGEPDTHNTDCMTDCVDTVEVSSEMPEDRKSVGEGKTDRAST